MVAATVPLAYRRESTTKVDRNWHRHKSQSPSFRPPETNRELKRWRLRFAVRLDSPFGDAIGPISICDVVGDSRRYRQLALTLSKFEILSSSFY